MGLSKSTIKNILIAASILILGIAIGVLINDIPYITLDREVDLGVCIAILGLVATVFYIPYVVERKFARADGINEVIRNDLSSIHADVERLKSLYVSIKPNTTIKESTYTEVLASFKTISSAILALNAELEKRDCLKGFKNDIYDDRFIPAKDACTENLIVGNKMDTRVTLDAMSELGKLSAALKKYRYNTYSDE